MKRCLITIMILSFLTACQAMATVEDTGIETGDVSGNPWNGTLNTIFAHIFAQSLLRGFRFPFRKRQPYRARIRA